VLIGVASWLLGRLATDLRPTNGELQRAYSDALDSAKGVTGMLRLGFCAHSRAGPHIFEIIKTFERRYSGCKVKVTEVDTDNDQIDRLNREELDVIVLRLPSDDPELVIGPVLLREPRVLLVNSDHLLAGRSSVVLEDLAGYVSAGEAGVPTELLDILSPPVTPSGRPIRRVILQSPHEVAMRTAAGELVHPTVPSFFETYRQQGLVALPIDDLPDLTRALAWLRSNNALKIRAFVQIAGSVLEGSPSSEGLQG